MTQQVAVHGGLVHGCMVFGIGHRFPRKRWLKCQGTHETYAAYAHFDLDNYSYNKASRDGSSEQVCACTKGT